MVWFQILYLEFVNVNEWNLLCHLDSMDELYGILKN